MADLCSVCGRASRDGKLRRGMCHKHYERWRVHGDPTKTLLTMPDQRGAPRHGTASKYNSGCRCSDCLTANREYMKQWRKGTGKDTFLAGRKRWRDAHPESVRLSSWATDQRRRRLPPTEDTVAYAAILFDDPCSYCGGSAGWIDHITAQARGGDGDWTNLTAACGSCNSQKHTKSLLHFMLGRVG